MGGLLTRLWTDIYTTEDAEDTEGNFPDVSFPLCPPCPLW